jgi:hypothetical protein
MALNDPSAMILPARCRRIRIGPWPRILAGECSTFLEVVCGISRIVISAKGVADGQAVNITPPMT